MPAERIHGVFEDDATGSGGSAWMTRPTIDVWDGLSGDLIGRFVEVTGLERELSRAARYGYRVDLFALDCWMRETVGHTLVTASTAQLWAYFRRRIAAGVEPRLLDRLMTSMRDFYRHLRESGCRDDDPAVSLPDWVHRSAMSGGGTHHAVAHHVHG